MTEELLERLDRPEVLIAPQEDVFPPAPPDGLDTVLFEQDERDARADLRRQIAAMELALARLFGSAFPRKGIDFSVPGMGGPRMLSVDELARPRRASGARPSPGPRSRCPCAGRRSRTAWRERAPSRRSDGAGQRERPARPARRGRYPGRPAVPAGTRPPAARSAPRDDRDVRAAPPSSVLLYAQSTLAARFPPPRGPLPWLCQARRGRR